jgi:hypothetical protein
MRADLEIGISRAKSPLGMFSSSISIGGGSGVFGSVVDPPVTEGWKDILA